jgi:hypothetical protein
MAFLYLYFWVLYLLGDESFFLVFHLSMKIIKKTVSEKVFFSSNRYISLNWNVPLASLPFSNFTVYQ